MKIFKYPLSIIDVQGVDLPVSAAILSVQCQGDELVMWALVRPGSRTETRLVTILGTGELAPDHWTRAQALHDYIGTVQMPDGLVWHVFCEETR